MPLAKELAELQANGYQVDTVNPGDGWTFVVIHDFELPDGYNKRVSDLLVKIPPGYPAAQLDMFWMDADLALAAGGIPRSCSHETVMGKVWLRFSWHPTKWNPSSDNVNTFLRFIRRRVLQRE